MGNILLFYFFSKVNWLKILNTSENNWELKFAKLITKQKEFRVINDSTMDSQNWELILAKNLQKFTLKQWHNLFRKFLTFFISLSTLGILWVLLHSIIILFHSGNTLIDIVQIIYPLVLLLFISIIVTGKLLNVKKPNLELKGNSCHVSWVKY